MEYDVAVIGAGPAGLMAAGRAGELGAKTVVLEKNQSGGLKLLMTGGTRCNLTNYLEDKKILASHFGLAGRFLMSAFSRFGPQETIDFFAELGLKTKTAGNNRVFPAEGSAQTVLRVLLAYVKRSGGEIKTGAAVVDIITEHDRIAELVLANGEKIKADSYVIATGGQSYPMTGSSGDAYQWLKQMGHKIVATAPALTPVIVYDPSVKDLEGLSREDVELKLFQAGKKIAASRGDLIFTADGLSGPAALDLSRFIRFPSPSGWEISLDFFPALDEEKLDGKFQEIFSGNNKIFKNSLVILIPPKLIPVLGKRLRLDLDKPSNSVTKIERRQLVRQLKNWRFRVKGLAGYDKAMITAGGLDLPELDPKTMRSKLIANLFVVGEVLDIAGPTGGFNLQACWSTGRIAGEAAAADK